MNEIFYGKPLWLWIVFLSIVFTLLILDLGVLNKKQKDIEFKESLRLSGFYIAISILFGIYVWVSFGAQSGQEFFTGYLIEKSLSLDNIFVISLIFTYFHIEHKKQHRLLFWGILGALVLRALLIGMGAALINTFEWISYVFSAFLVVTGIKMLFMSTEHIDLENNKLLLFLKRHLPQRLANSRAFMALIMIEISDLIFAIDSVPAIFTITKDPYIVYTSNIFAILGLRALYFSLASLLKQFTYLKYSLSLILVFIGAKAFIAWAFALEKIPASLSLGVTILLIGGGIVWSIYKAKPLPPS